MKVDVSYSNFARGKIDHDLSGRYDLPIYQSGADLIENFITNFKGNAIYRAGFEIMEEFQDCVMVEFKFNNAQQYICLFYNTKIRFLSYDANGNFGWVLDGGLAILEVTTPYSLAESRQIQYSQNNDVMVVVHPTYPPRKLVRVSANSFTFNTFARTNDPFTSSGNYPSSVLFYKGGLYYAATNTKITTVFRSVLGSYDDFTSTPVTDKSAITFTIAEISQRIEWLFPGDNSLIVGASDGIVAVNGGSVNDPITAATIEATLTSAPGCNGVYPLKKDGLVFYMGVDGRNMNYFSYDLLKEAFQASDANLLSYDITVGGITKLRYKKDRNDLIFCTTANEDGSMLSCNFDQDEKIVGWHDHPTEGMFLDEAVITDNDGKPQLFSLSLRNGSYYIERQSAYIEFKNRVQFFTDFDRNDTSDAETSRLLDDAAYNRYVAEQLKECIFLDGAMVLNNLQSNLITYSSGAGTISATNNVFSSGDIGKHIVYKTLTGYESGRFEITGYTNAKVVTVSVLQIPTSNTYTDWYLTFSSVSGLGDYTGTTVSVVADGGYLDDFSVPGTTISLGTQVTSVVIGYKYKGIIKSFCLGFQIQGISTQATMKAISQFGVRCVATAGLEVGSSLYKTEVVQELTQDDINYLPPIPIDGTKYVSFSDDNERDKFFYIVQEDPLPAVITSVILTANYAVGA